MAKAPDYSTMRDLNDPTKVPAPDPENSKPRVQWWKAEPGPDLAQAVFAQVYALLQADKMRIQQYSNHCRYYGNQSGPLSNVGFTITTINANQSPVRDRMAFNLQQSCVDTLTSKIAKNKPKPFFLTSKGDSKLQRKAKKLDQYCTGIFYANHAYDWMMPRCFRDGCVTGTGLIFPYASHGRVVWERVPEFQVLTDYLECFDGPEMCKTIHRVKMIDRTVLEGMMTAAKLDIRALSNTNQLMSGTSMSVSDTVTVVESWRLASYPGAEDGMHCITAPGVTLRADNKYNKTRVPFGVFRYSPRMHGFWGQGLVEQLTPIQTELNRCLMSVQRSFHLGATFKVLLHAGSKVVKSHIDNTVGAIIQWAGEVAPQYITPPLVQPEIYQQIQALKQMGYEQSGISQLSASSQKPAGLNSGKALRESVDIETDRFQVVGQGYEALALDLAELSVDVERDIKTHERQGAVKVPGKRFLDSIKWEDVDMEEDEYVMQIFPVSKLPSDPEGRLETITELMQAGIIAPDVGRRLLDYPDLEAEETLANAQQDYLHQCLDTIIEDGKYVVPDPYLEPAAATKVALEYYFVGLRDDLDKEKLAYIRQFMQALNNPPGAPTPGTMPPQGQAPAGQPQAVPQAPPTSALLPNAPGGAAA